MSLFGMMRTSVSGMQAQSSRLSAVADNIANSDTTGYKSYSTEFSQLVRPGASGLNAAEGESGGVLSDLRQSVGQQGAIRYTQTSTDLAINGEGFFVVQDPNGQSYLTRAGSFVPDDEGRLVNAAGLILAGYEATGGAPAPVANGFGGLVPVTIDESELTANVTTLGRFHANLPATDPAATAPLPSTNDANAGFGHKTSLVAYGTLGEPAILDIYFTKTGAETWEVAVYDQAEASVPNGFPYAGPVLGQTTLLFDPATGQQTGASAPEFSVTLPDEVAPAGTTMTISMGDTVQLATDYTVIDASTNGNAPTPLAGVEIGADGAVVARYGDGSLRELYRVPLANVVSPGNLAARTGSVFLPSNESGEVTIGFPGTGSNGTLITSALEQSNVDLAEELTTMIQSQRGYTANSKVFQTGSDLMDVLVNLKR